MRRVDLQGPRRGQEAPERLVLVRGGPAHGARGFGGCEAPQKGLDELPVPWRVAEYNMRRVDLRGLRRVDAGKERFQ